MLDFSTIMLDQLEKHAKSSGNYFNRNETLQSSRYPKNPVKHMDKKQDRFTNINPELGAMTLVLEAIADSMLLNRKSTTTLIKRSLNST